MLQLGISHIRIDGGTQPRAGLNPELTDEYAEAMTEGTKFPPATVFYDGQDYWLADGFHRLHAALKAGLHEIAVEVRQGNRRDAVLHAVGANAHHGLRRTNADKRRAILVLLNDPEWSQWGNREIAKQCGVNEKLVRILKEELNQLSADCPQIDPEYVKKCGVTEMTLREVQQRLKTQSRERTAQRHGTTYTISTANIGRRDNDVALLEKPALTEALKAKPTDETLVGANQTGKQIPGEAETETPLQFEVGSFVQCRDSDSPCFSEISEVTSPSSVGTHGLTPEGDKHFLKKGLESTVSSKQFVERVNPEAVEIGNNQLEYEAAKVIDRLSEGSSEVVPNSKPEASDTSSKEVLNECRIISIEQENHQQVEEALQTFEVIFPGVRIEIEGRPATLITLFQRMQSDSAFAEEVLRQAVLPK